MPFFAKTFHASPLQLGLLYSVYSFCQLLFSPVWGGLSDRWGRRPIMLLSTFGSALSYVIFAFAPSLGVLFFSRIIAGLMAGNIATAQAYVSDVTSHRDRAKGMGLIGAAFGVGFMLGPAIAAALSHPAVSSLSAWSADRPYALPGLAAAVLSSLSFVLVALRLPETVAAGQAPAASERPSVFLPAFWRKIANISAHGRKPIFSLLLICILLISFSQSNLYSAFPLFCESMMGLNASEVGLLFAWMGLIAIGVQGGLIRYLTRKITDEKLFITGSVLMTAGLVWIPFTQVPAQLVAALTVMSVGGSLNVPTVFSLTSKEAGAGQVGATLGLSQGMAGLGRMGGPAWGGFLYGFVFWLPFIAAGAIVASTVALSGRIMRLRL